MSTPIPIPDHLSWLSPFAEEAVACTCELSGATHRSLVTLLSVQSADGGGTCRTRVGSLEAIQVDDLAEMACVVADRAMRWRCSGSVANYRLWRDAVNHDVALSDDDRRKVAPFITTVFGSPAKPKPDIHVFGWVAEFVWFQITLEIPDRPGQVLRRVEGPGFHRSEERRGG